MKKVILTITSLIMAVVIAFAFSSCNKKGKEEESSTDAAEAVSIGGEADESVSAAGAEGLSEVSSVLAE